MTREQPAPVAPGDFGELRAQYLRALLAPDARGARELTERACDAGISAADLYLRVLHPAMHEIGRLWESARISVAAEHLATQIAQATLAGLALRLSPRSGVGTGRTAVVSCSPGERHAIGGQMVSDFLEADGWRVLALGPDAPSEALCDLVRRERPDVVALSTALPANLLAAGHACTLLRQLPETPFIVAGGQAYAGSARRAQAVGADVFAADPDQLLELLGERFGGPAS